MQKTKKSANRLLALLLSIMMLVSMLPLSVFAEETTGAAADAVVTLTVSNRGVLATAADGSVMANKEVTVKDIDSDGKLTFDEALVAAHAAYNSADGYAAGSAGVTKLWGVTTSNVLFFMNNVGLTTGVKSDTVKGGDRLVASINADDTYYADWYAAFDRAAKTVTVGEDITLTLKGHLGMAYTEEDMADAALSGISVGTVSGGSFTAIEGKTTDADGKVTLSFDAAGTYYVTASGTVKDTVTDWNLMNMSTPDNPVYGKMDFDTYDTSMAYTEKDYGDGPYPAGEVKWVDFDTWVDNQDSYHTLRSNRLTTDCPIIAPVCVVKVTEIPRLASLNISKEWTDGGNYYALTPAFDPDVTEYSITVPDYASSVFPYAKLAEGTEGKGIGYYGFNSMFGGFGWSSSNNVNVSGGYFGVVIYDRSNSMSDEDIRYTVNISKHATLKDMTVDGVGTLDFDRDTNTGYHYYVDSTQDGVDITATAYKNSYTITIDGNTATGGEVYRLAYDWDENGKMEVPVTVAGENVELYTYTVVLEKQPRNDTPYLMTQPEEADYIIGDDTTALSVIASSNGEMTYQWYANTTDSTTGGTAISGATQPSYTPPADEVGTLYYYCVVTNEDKTVNNTAVSETARVTVDPDPTPKATILNPGSPLSGYDWDTGYVYNVDDEANALTVTATSDAEGGTWSYRWYSPRQAYNFSGYSSAPGNSTAESYTPSTALNMANSTGKFYACRVSYTFKGKTYTSWATTGETYTEGEGEEAETYDVTGVYVFIDVDKAETPVITKQPVGASYIEGDRMTNLSVSASRADGGTLSYQWYVNDTNRNWGGTAIADATSNSYAPGTAAEGGTKYYYCVVTNTIQGYSSSVASETASIYIKTVQDLVGDKLSGTGTEADPYLIKDAQDYQDLADLVAGGMSFQGKYLKQENDITLPDGWQSIGVLKDPSITHINGGKNMLPFSGTLDGNQKTVTVPEGGSPLLGYVKGATVKNLNIYGKKIAGYGLVDHLEGVSLSGEAICIDNVTLKSGSSTLKSGLIGTYLTNNGFAGCSAAFYVTIRNCTIEKDVVIGYNKDQSMIGSIAGRIHGTIDNCVSYATVYGTNYVGGILGTRDNAMGGCAVTNCTFGGTVEASGEQAGGIVGGGYSNSTAPNGAKVNVENCSSSGTITGADKVGGIVGADSYVVQLWGNHSLKNNSFTGTVKATSGTYVGGIIGYYASLNKYDGITGNYYKTGCGADRGIGYVKYVDTNCATHETAGGAIYINTADGESGIGGITKTDHNRTDDPLGADAGKLCYTDSTPATATELLVSGTYKTEYTKGDALDLTGIELTVAYNIGKTETIALKDVTIAGFDPQKVGRQEITLSYKGVTATVLVEVRNPKGEIVVTVSILGDGKHNSETDGKTHTLAAGNLETWVKAKEYTVDSNVTVLDVLTEIFAANGMTVSNPTGNYIESVTYKGVELGALTNGPLSGWMYTLNGEYPDLGVAEQILSDDDVIVFHYTDDYTQEGASEEPEKTVQDVIVLIDAIGTVTLDSGDAIAAARTAYNNLSAEQKELVDNYETLVEAEKAYAQLIQENNTFEKVYKATSDYLASLGVPDVGSIGGEWIVIGLARSNREVPDEYYDAVIAYVRENINDKEQLASNKSTENSRIILALTALGLDVTDVDGHNLLQGLTDMDYLKSQGPNGPIWALIAFDSHDYEIPTAPEGADPVTREKLVAYLLEQQLDDGGWALSGDAADPDMTAMAIQALAPYYKTDADVKAAVDEALARLSDIQQPTGGYSSWGTANAESCAQVIVALTALGIDPDNDPRFMKNGVSVLDALLSFAVDGGGFKHTAGGNVNGMATEQGYYALAAYDRFLNDKTSLYDMSDVTIGDNPDVPAPEDKDITLTDVEGTGVTATGKESILNGLELEANLLTSGELYDKVKEALKDGKFTLYDLYLLKNSYEEIQPDGTITVSIPVPDSYDGAQCKVYRVNEDGSVTEVTAVLKDGKLTFETDQMGAYAVYQPVKVDTDEPGDNDDTTKPGDNDDTTEPPKTGDNDFAVVWFTLSLCSLTALIAVSRKKKAVK